MLLLAAAVFAYFTLADDGGLLGGRASLPERPTGLPLAEWGEAPLVVYLSAGADGQLVIETQTEFEAGVGTMSVWVEVGDARAEFVNYDALYIAERSAAWIGELRAARDGTARPQEAPAAAQSVWAQHRGKLTQTAREYRCLRWAEEDEGEARAGTSRPQEGEATWICELR